MEICKQALQLNPNDYYLLATMGMGLGVEVIQKRLSCHLTPH